MLRKDERRARIGHVRITEGGWISSRYIISSTLKTQTVSSSFLGGRDLLLIHMISNTQFYFSCISGIQGVRELTADIKRLRATELEEGIGELDKTDSRHQQLCRLEIFIQKRLEFKLHNHPCLCLMCGANRKNANTSIMMYCWTNR